MKKSHKNKTIRTFLFIYNLILDAIVVLILIGIGLLINSMSKTYGVGENIFIQIIVYLSTIGGILMYCILMIHDLVSEAIRIKKELKNQMDNT